MRKGTFALLPAPPSPTVKKKRHGGMHDWRVGNGQKEKKVLTCSASSPPPSPPNTETCITDEWVTVPAYLMHVLVFSLSVRGGRGRWKEGKWVFSHCLLVDLMVLVTTVWMRDITVWIRDTSEPKFDCWTKLAQTKVQGPTYPSPKVQGQFWLFCLLK